MSKSLFVGWYGDGFWAYDVAMALFLKHLIDASLMHDRGAEPWLVEAVDNWRFNTITGDCGLFLDGRWTDEQLSLVVQLVEEACEHVSSVDGFSASDTESWDVYEGCGVTLRGAQVFPSAPVAELGRALGSLLNGDLAEPPSGTWWFHGVEGGPVLIRKKR